MWSSRLAGILAIGAVAIFTSPVPARAFCIENRAEETLTFSVDTDGRGLNAPFVTTIGPGSQACCDWQRYDCNMSGEEDGIVTFSVNRVVGMDEWTCWHEYYANDEVYFTAREGRSGCGWGRTTGPIGLQLWDELRNWLADMFYELMADRQSS